MPYELNEILEMMYETEATGLYLTVGNPPIIRIQGKPHVVDGPSLEPKDTHAMMNAIASTRHQESIKSRGGADFAFSYADKTRFRVSIFKTKGSFSIVLRQIPSKIKSIKELGIPEVVLDLIQRPKGILFVTGPTCSGKTTSIASMIDWLNDHTAKHIITIEDPIEFYHSHKKSIISQREVGVDVTTFSEAIVRSLRQDPDIIMIGEMRDVETMQAAVTAAETGHLVLATLHTTGASNTVDRILDSFAHEARQQVRAQLAASMIGVISQDLCKRKDGGLVAAFEVMVSTSSIRALIRDAKTYRITSEIQTGSALGMVTLEHYLKSLYEQDIIDYQELASKLKDVELDVPEDPSKEQA